MKTTRRRTRAFTIIECMVYAGVYVVLLGAAFVAFYRSFDNMKQLYRTTDDITRTVHAGEVWRADIRAATQLVELDAAAQMLRIHRGDREVTYRFADGQVLRQSQADAPWAVLLPNVAHSEMQVDHRAQMTTLRWEVELQTKTKNVRVRPLFTFIATPPQS